MSDEENNPQAGAVLAYVLLVALALVVVVVALASMGNANVPAAAIGIGCLALMVPLAIYLLRSSTEGKEDTVVTDYSKRTENVQTEEMLQLLRSINERLLFSERAKQISYRAKDLDLLRSAIEEDIKAQQYDAALVLSKEMADVYGYRENAEAYRQQIIDARASAQEEQINTAADNVQKICETGDFDTALREVDRLQRLYPEEPRIRRLPMLVDKAMNSRKRDLEREFLRASEVGDFDKAMELMKELDKHLSPEEAEPYLEIARGVVGQKRENLGVQFRMRIQDHDWVGAYQIGQQVIQEFPNSKMADEVRQMLDGIRKRAVEQQTAMSKPAPAAEPKTEEKKEG